VTLRRGLPSINERRTLKRRRRAMIEAAIDGALSRGIEFNGNALAIAQFKTPSSHGQSSN
jgi:hypothetical protein